jgi:hypothetical protein
MEIPTGEILAAITATLRIQGLRTTAVLGVSKPGVTRMGECH